VVLKSEVKCYQNWIVCTTGLNHRQATTLLMLKIGVWERSLPETEAKVK